MLRSDSDRQLQQMRGRLVPDGSDLPNGYVLSITGQSPFEYDWRQPADAEILRGHASPNGVKFAPKGSLYVDVDAPALWQNDDGLSSWVQVGTGAPAALSRVLYLLGIDASEYTTFTEADRVGASDVTSDITLGSSDDDTLIVNTPGIYAVQFNYNEIGMTEGTELKVDLSFLGWIDGDLDPVTLMNTANAGGHAGVSYSFVGYLADGLPRSVYGIVPSASGSLTNSWCVVQRLA